jgi:hypothetical protein
MSRAYRAIDDAIGRGDMEAAIGNVARAMNRPTADVLRAQAQRDMVERRALARDIGQARVREQRCVSAAAAGSPGTATPIARRSRGKCGEQGRGAVLGRSPRNAAPCVTAASSRQKCEESVSTDVFRELSAAPGSTPADYGIPTMRATPRQVISGLDASRKEGMMKGRMIRDLAAALAAGAGVLLLADLSLGWYSVSVSVAGVSEVKATASGWSNVGVVSGLLTIAMLVYMIRPIRYAGAIDFMQAAVTAALGLAALGFTIAAALTTTASITAPETAIEVGSRLWPAYVGIGLGACVAAGTLTALFAFLRGVTAPSAAMTPVPVSRGRR